SVFDYLTKPTLRKWLSQAGVIATANCSRDDLIFIARENSKKLDLQNLESRSDLFVQRKVLELEYLLFLFFGRIQRNLTLYTLRDLGIREARGMKKKFKPRFTKPDEAKTEYFFSKQIKTLDEIEDEEDIRRLFQECLGYSTLNTSARGLKNQLIYDMANRINPENPDLILEILEKCEMHPAREKSVRILFKLDRKNEGRVLLEAMIENPFSDEELLFAEDFLARKFNNKKVGYLTEILKSAQELILSDFYLKRPEWGVRDYFRKQGHGAEFTENYLWAGLFGLLFWDELFESEEAAIFNPFERSPSDLVGSDFYENHREKIEEKLLLLSDVSASNIYFLKAVTTHYGKLNDIFQWHPSLLTTILEFVGGSQNKNLATIMRTMAQNYENYHSGYPDLVIFQNSEPKFIEVKAEGDSLRSKQLSKVRLLKEAGYEVEVLKVRWQTDPNQVYVVVDVETTGGSAQFHRVTEIGALKVQGGVVVDEFQTLINPGRPIPKHITDITGITNEMVADAPKFSEIAERFEEFTREAIFVAHNVRFDYSFIQKEFQRLEMPFVRPQICTCSGMRKTYPGLSSYGLKNLTEHFEISIDQHHRALCDAKAATELLMIMNKKRESEGRKLDVTHPENQEV
ncbi:MAG: exonuclease domain-containing protein, partial [Pseudobdellovibrionaceae bacterium]